jgi:hypothetical protein
MPGQLPRGADVPRDYASVKRLAKEKMSSLVGKTIIVGMKRNTYAVTWKVIDSHIATKPLQEKLPTRAFGIKDLNLDLKKVRFYPGCF